MTIMNLTRDLVSMLSGLDEEQRVLAINEVRRAIHEVSPFKDEPVDFVEWVKSDVVHANSWNPNRTAPPEQRLLERSIEEDGYTQPVVAFPETTERFEVVDGYHRTRVGKEAKAVRERVRGYLPIVLIKPSRAGTSDRMSSTVRHNRARGVHGVEAMGELVRMLYQSGWSDAQIQKELGMGPDEVMRLKQITGLAELFADREFSEAWEPLE